MRPGKSLLFLIVLLLVPGAAAAQASKQELNDQLWEAARKGDAPAVTALLDKGADVNAKFRYGTTALFKASERGHLEVVKVLLARGADATVKDTFYSATAMTWALQNKHLEVVRALLEKDATAVDDILTTGTREGNAVLVRMALDRGGASAETLTSALALAASDAKTAEIAEMLKKAGAKPPLEVSAETLQTYVGRYKADPGPEISISLKEGKLFATPLGQQPFLLMATDQTAFRPVAFGGATITFNVEGGKVTGFALKQGPNTTQLKRVE
jgi:ankyrin repeat protein